MPDTAPPLTVLLVANARLRAGGVAVAEAALLEGEVAGGARGALPVAEVALTLALASVGVAIVVERPVRVAFAS